MQQIVEFETESEANRFARLIVTKTAKVAKYWAEADKWRVEYEEEAKD